MVLWLEDTSHDFTLQIILKQFWCKVVWGLEEVELTFPRAASIVRQPDQFPT